jgi:hypothetical protein
MSNYRIVVGNIGEVLSCSRRDDANRCYNTYVEESKTEYGRVSGEPVTMFQGDTIVREYTPKAKLPTIAEIRSLLVALKPTIADDYRSEGSEDGPPSMDVTIGWTPSTGSWSYQTGDNSFTGGAYGHPHWAVISLNRRSNSTELAKDIIEQLADLHAMQ